MVSALSFVWFPLTCAVMALPLQPEQQSERSGLAAARCGAVNFFVTAFLPQAHATALCSAYLQVPMQSVTITAIATALPLTVTETSNKIMPTLTRSITQMTTSTNTRTVDLWTGTPACSTVPNFHWLRDRQKRPEAEPIALLDLACSCLAIPTSTTTVEERTTTTPTVKITQGLVGSTEVTATTAQTVIETRTKFIFLFDLPEPTHLHEAVASEPESRSATVANRLVGAKHCQSYLGSSNTTKRCRDSTSSLALIEFGSKLGLSQMY